ncbi:MAG TPA: DUF4013 domain-containing protein [Candidatus Bathyarchaeia archaeon]|nr:DUF4013 domain-containing protein [Candidatus Bathyarchaeia archaeon]
MRLSENFSNSFYYAKKLLDDGGRIILLIVLDLIPVVNWIVVGYGARVLREAPSSESSPKLENYGSLFVDGAKIFFASLIYMLFPIILIMLGAASFFAERFSTGKALRSSAVLGGAGILVVLLGMLLGFILLILLGVGMAHMVKTGKFSKAFAFGEIIKILNGIGKMKYLGWVILTSLIAILIGGITGSVPYIGWLLSAIISPFLTVFIFRSLGDLYNDGAPPELKVVITPSLTGMTGNKCASCGTPLQPHHKFCPACGAAAPVRSVMETKLCVVCGIRIPATAIFCGSCGAKQN